MKKFLSFILITIMCVLPLCACSTDFSGQITGAMDDLYNSIKEIAEPFLKQDDKYSSDTNTGSSTENDTGNINGEGTNNNPGGAIDNNANRPSKPENMIGTNIGNYLPDFTLQVFDENGYTDKVIDPTMTGKVTVINFWGIWCHFCLEELPAFSEVAGEYGDEIVMVAIHSTDYFNRGAADYVNANFANSEIVFAKDVNLDGNNLDDCYETFGGVGYYPYTIIIDANGVITYKIDGAISKAVLKNQVEKALGN